MIPAETLNAAPPSVAPGARMVALADPLSAAAEQYRVLFYKLEHLAARRPARVVAVTSAGRGEGRTTTAANLAFTAAGEGRSALLVEADLRRPSLAALLGLSPRAGLAEVLAGTAELPQAVVHVGALSVLCAGQVRDAAALLHGARPTAVMGSLRAAYEHVYLDAPPALAFAGGDRLVAEADLAVLVVRARVTPRQVVGLALEALGERAAGIVMNDVGPESSLHGRWLYADRPETGQDARRRARGS